jgi:phage portal protein BeeE
MKSSIRKFRNAGSPIPLATSRRLGGGQMMNLRGGPASMETYLRAYGRSGTVNSIVSLLAEAAAFPAWNMYKKPTSDGRARYTTSDRGSDQRVQVTQHAALSLWNNPNDFHTGFTFREGANQHFELVGETFWVLDMEQANFPTSMWYVRPDRMEPVPDPDLFIVGWIYTGPNGEQVPLRLNEVIQEKRPDPMDPMRGMGPTASVMANIEQQDFATMYQRNLFMNGAQPGGIITVPNKLRDRDFDELVDRWREAHLGIARAGKVGVLENGAQWMPGAHTNQDLEYGNLRLANRDELREAWRMHKAMLGTVEDVNRANAQTAEEVFISWMIITRLERRADTVNFSLLPKFYPGLSPAQVPVEFDFQDPSPDNREEDNAELSAKTTAFATLVTAGVDPDDAADAVGLPRMSMVEQATQAPALPPGWVAAPAPTAAPTSAPTPPAQTDKQQQVSDELADILRGEWRRTKMNGKSHA